ncbi:MULTISPECIES: LysM peptidoglycan-binding domain-containing protein [Methylobacterium]|uniref:LysM domain-containing protein n=1 Tax=Methylobacterium thuringiense TaxID=1003091 RepID=A0ABQ4TPJ2_9HYPH|nr:MULTISPECIES: LysM peptidoglycan-binding domain-containing protein [Methylobacterium]TXN20686.1 LysM peptidoglycan-binding domain-containing protein [Methylobacterium sp. WL9]GJE56538.1 hypothetical protein EKPJFOCH_3044 [Methylobacterium thuringiense]
MTAGLGRGLALAGIGAAVGLAVVAALFGTGDLLKRVRGSAVTGETSRPAADLPQGKAGSEANAEKPRPNTGDQAAIEPNKKPLAGPGGVLQAETGRADEARTPSLDILRVEPSGDAVLAGRGAPKASVELLRDNKTVARATADESGQFAIDSLTLPPGNSELTLRSTTPDGKTTEGRASAVVVIDRDRKAQPLVAVSEPDKPTRVLSMPSPAVPKSAEAARDAGSEQGKDPGKPAPAGGTPPRREAALSAAGGKPAAPMAESTPVKIVSVDAQDGGRLFVSGQGAAWTSLRLYLNDTLVASGRSGADGRIAFTIGRGVKPGGYQIRIDQVDDTSGKVGQRAQVGFTFPSQLAAKEAARHPVRTASKEASSTPTKPETQPARSPESAASPPSSAEPHAAAGVAGSNAAMLSAETDKRTAEAVSPKLPGAGTSAPRQSPLGASPPPAKQLPTQPQRPDMAAAVAPTPGDPPATVFVPEIDTAKITRGDNLWQISRRSYGDGKRYTVIYDANRNQIRDPNLIYPGQIFVMPKDAPASDRQGANRG